MISFNATEILLLADLIFIGYECTVFVYVDSSCVPKNLNHSQWYHTTIIKTLFLIVIDKLKNDYILK